MKSFFTPIRANWWVLESFRPTEPKNDWFPLSRHDVPRVHESFFLADSSELMGVRVISAYWAQKRLIPTFLTRCKSSSWKLFSPIRANWSVLESFRPPEPKNVWFPLSRHDVHWVDKKFFSRWFARTDGCKSHFGLLSAKTFDSHFLDTMYLEFMKNFFLADSSELICVRVISATWAKKRLIPIF